MGKPRKGETSDLASERGASEGPLLVRICWHIGAPALSQCTATQAVSPRAVPPPSRAGAPPKAVRPAAGRSSRMGLAGSHVLGGGSPYQDPTVLVGGVLGGGCLYRDRSPRRYLPGSRRDAKGVSSGTRRTSVDAIVLLEGVMSGQPRPSFAQVELGRSVRSKILALFQGSIEIRMSKRRLPCARWGNTLRL